jgi:hypothetical protein
MAYLRKTLGSADASYVRSLMALMETQSKATLIRWCVCYTRANILPIYEQAYPCDGRPRQSLDAAEAWLAGAIRFPMARKLILQAHAAAREASDHPAAQAAARAAAQAASSIHVPSHALGLAFYGAAAVAYDQLGPGRPDAAYEEITALYLSDMEASLRRAAIPNEPNPARIVWHL